MGSPATSCGMTARAWALTSSSVSVKQRTAAATAAECLGAVGSASVDIAVRAACRTSALVLCVKFTQEKKNYAFETFASQ